MIPDDLFDDVWRLNAQGNPYCGMLPGYKPPPLTLWQRMRFWWWRIRSAVMGSIHDRIFGHGEYCRGDWDY